MHITLLRVLKGKLLLLLFVMHITLLFFVIVTLRVLKGKLLLLLFVMHITLLLIIRNA